MITSLTDWRAPLDGLDICCIVKTYLDKRGITDSRFKDNMPGPDWVRSFVKRHNLTKRVADNVKHSRAIVNEEVLEEYFKFLYEELKDIPPENIYNYDETNITDDPGVEDSYSKKRSWSQGGKETGAFEAVDQYNVCWKCTWRISPPMIV